MLKITNLSKTFHAGTANERVAIDKVSLSLAKGEFVTLIGSNGSGKSTLFNLIGGNFFPDNGHIELDGVDITFDEQHIRAKNIGRLFQDPLKGTAPSMTIEENLALCYMRSKKKGFSIGVSKEDTNFFRERLSRLNLGLEDRMKTKMGLLSGGQRQAVTLLMCTLVTPKLLLLDEHTAALDPATADKVLEITDEIVSENNITTMMITHNITSALQMGTRTIMMDNGKIILDIKENERKEMTIEKLLELFKKASSQNTLSDRMLFS